MWVKSEKSISFPKLNWGINAGETKELPTFKTKKETEAAHERILSEPEITKTSAPAADKE